MVLRIPNDGLKHIFRKALADKYEVKRGDEIDEPGMITSQVLRLIQECPLVVADLTGHNPNVLYELAVRHAMEKPVIHIIESKLSKIPFDIAGFRTIDFDLTDPESIESAVDQLKKQTEQAEAGKWGETPVKLANIMQRSKADSMEIVLLKQAVEGIAKLHTRIAQMGGERIVYPTSPSLQQGSFYIDYKSALDEFGRLRPIQPVIPPPPSQQEPDSATVNRKEKAEQISKIKEKKKKPDQP